MILRCSRLRSATSRREWEPLSVAGSHHDDVTRTDIVFADDNRSTVTCPGDAAKAGASGKLDYFARRSCVLEVEDPYRGRCSLP